MSQAVSVWLVLAVALVAANLPFINERLFVVGPRLRPAKAFAWRPWSFTGTDQAARRGSIFVFVAVSSDGRW